MLAMQAYFPSLQPAPCGNSGQWSNCKDVSGHKAAILYTALYIIALGEGSLRANLPPFGADQFDEDDMTNSRSKSSYFNWLNFSILGGSVIGLIFIVWIENTRGWGEGFSLSAGVMILGVLVLASGFKFFRYQIPGGSPLTRTLQVLVAAYRKRNLPLPEEQLLHKKCSNEEMVGELLPHTNDFEFLDKASISNGSTGNWSLCTVTQVEETKIILRILPIFISAVLAYIPIPLLLTFSIQQGSTMNTRLCEFNVSPVSLVTIPLIFQMVFLVIYDRFFVPLASRITGYRTGITHLKRIGVGFLLVSLATCIAALIEKKRKSIAEEHGLINSDMQVPMSVMWLGPQCFGIVITDVFTYVGLLEFFNTEASRGMKSTGTAIFWCFLGLASLLGSVLVEVVNKATRHGSAGTVGWIGGKSLNQNYLDRFYWLLSILSLVGFLNFLFWARRYMYRKNDLAQ